MKNLKQLITISLIITGFLAFSQGNEKKALSYFNKGLIRFQKQDYLKAKSLFSTSIELMPQKATYYNLALTLHHLGDTCGFCDNIKNASKLGDQEAGELFESHCVLIKKMIFDIKSHPDSSFFANFSSYRCNGRIFKREYCIKNLKNNTISTYIPDEPGYSTATSDENSEQFPDLNKFSYYREEIVSDREEIVSDTPIFTVVEDMPSFPGGDDARIKMLVDNIKYPQFAKEKGIQGTVYVTFVINTDGNVSDVKVLRGIGGGCDEEAVRVVNLMPKWKPGYQDGKPVRVQFNMPIRFTLTK
jgi:TonB family protein